MLQELMPLLPPRQAARARALGNAPRVAYEDDWLAVISKPQGVPTQGAGGSLQQADWILGQLAPSRAFDALSLARPAHRLDSGTGGLIVMAKTSSSLERLSALFAQRQVHKRYRAMVHGQLPLVDGVYEEAVDGKPARTRYAVTAAPTVASADTCDAQNFQVSAVDLWPHTGRRHQLRKHLSSMGHPIVGDKRYGGETLGVEEVAGEDSCDSDDGGDESVGLGRTFYLWALEIQFPHPAHGVPSVPSSRASDINDTPMSKAMSMEAAQLPGEKAVKLRGSDLDAFRQLHFGLDQAPKKKAKKAKRSNLVKDSVSESPFGLRPGDMLVSISISGQETALGKVADDANGKSATGSGAAIAEILHELKPAPDAEILLAFLHCPPIVVAKIDEPESFALLIKAVGDSSTR